MLIYELIYLSAVSLTKYLLAKTARFSKRKGTEPEKKTKPWQLFTSSKDIRLRGLMATTCAPTLKTPFATWDAPTELEACKACSIPSSSGEPSHLRLSHRFAQSWPTPRERRHATQSHLRPVKPQSSQAALSDPTRCAFLRPTAGDLGNQCLPGTKQEPSLAFVHSYP